MRAGNLILAAQNLQVVALSLSPSCVTREGTARRKTPPRESRISRCHFFPRGLFTILLYRLNERETTRSALRITLWELLRSICMPGVRELYSLRLPVHRSISTQLYLNSVWSLPMWLCGRLTNISCFSCHCLITQFCECPDHFISPLGMSTLLTENFLILIDPKNKKVCNPCQFLRV